MKKLILVLALTVSFGTPLTAWSQTAAPPSGAAPMPPARNVPNGDAGPRHGPDLGDPAQFQQHKSEMLQRMGEHIADMQKRQTCVQAASDGAALMNCMQPSAGMGPGGMHPGMGPGGIHPGMGSPGGPGGPPSQPTGK